MMVRFSLIDIEDVYCMHYSDFFLIKLVIDNTCMYVFISSVKRDNATQKVMNDVTSIEPCFFEGERSYSV